MERVDLMPSWPSTGSRTDMKAKCGRHRFDDALIYLLILEQFSLVVKD